MKMFISYNFEIQTWQTLRSFGEFSGAWIILPHILNDCNPNTSVGIRFHSSSWNSEGNNTEAVNGDEEESSTAGGGNERQSRCLPMFPPLVCFPVWLCICVVLCLSLCTLANTSQNLTPEAIRRSKSRIHPTKLGYLDPTQSDWRKNLKNTFSVSRRKMTTRH